MSAQPFLDLRGTHNPHRWYLPLTDAVCVGPPGKKFMFGGVGLGAAIAAMERTCGRPVIWAAAHYLSYARPPSVVDFDVWVPAEGRHNSQARVIAHVGDAEILTVNAALGSRPSDLSRQWIAPPDVPPPEDCAPFSHWRQDSDDLHAHLDGRVARGWYGGVRTGPETDDGRLLLWLRPQDALPIDASMLAILADHVPSGVGSALGLHAGGNSLDNTLRIVRLVETDWVLCDVRIEAVQAGFAHGSMRLFARSGELIAIASQSMIVRIHAPDPG